MIDFLYICRREVPNETVDRPMPPIRIRKIKHDHKLALRQRKLSLQSHE